MRIGCQCVQSSAQGRCMPGLACGTSCKPYNTIISSSDSTACSVSLAGKSCLHLWTFDSDEVHAIGTK